jgi:hypothetical protein
MLSAGVVEARKGRREGRREESRSCFSTSKMSGRKREVWPGRNCEARILPGSAPIETRWVSWRVARAVGLRVAETALM